MKKQPFHESIETIKKLNNIITIIMNKRERSRQVVVNLSTSIESIHLFSFNKI